jgi:hypothetical protein
MKFIIGKDRKQAALFPVSLEESIEIENKVRAIDLFVNSIDLEKMGFKVCFPEGGRPAYHPAVMLKLFIYGYLNRMRSSRILEKGCRRNITEVVYNIQSTVDAEHCIPIDYQVTNHNDKKAMGAMVRRAKSIPGNNDFTALFDKGYHTGSEPEIAQKLNIKTLVAIPAPASNAPDPNYNVQNFVYDPQEDHYICPQDHFLNTNGTFHVNHRGKPNETHFKQYKTKACNGCPVRELCTTAKNGRLLARNIYAPVYEQNRKNMDEDPELYRRRQAIVKHPFGKIKRSRSLGRALTISFPRKERNAPQQM